MCFCLYVTGFEKTRLPHTQYQTYDFTRNGLLAQYTIIFHCWPCSKATGLVSVAAFLRPCVALWSHWMVMALLYGRLDSVEWNGRMVEWNGNKLDTSDWFLPPYRPPLNKDHLLIKTIQIK